MDHTSRFIAKVDNIGMVPSMVRRSCNHMVYMNDRAQVTSEDQIK